LKGKKDVMVNEISSSKEYCSWEEVELLTKTVAQKIQTSNKKYDIILGITNGGIIPARLMARELDIDHIQFIPIRNKKLFKKEMPPLFKGKKYLIIDEILDAGETFSMVCNIIRMLDCDFAFLMSRYRYDGKLHLFIGKILNHNKWIVFPWEMKSNYCK
jgi:uncharacterized protein